ncbi:beta-ketoacyl synthase chain length factor [Rhodanobacter sp. B2A1Ga4]|uniref:beta-ketoacyl synthase chain length factor n=1 Tax=Rhodanobacter TaxID=75309 RepID=UPI000D360181|nr:MULTISPECIES: beta-ketoacyl synthase chain length factor [Rhodanobacter]MBQ4855032.1 beta-ketoacyl synthase chain length factor [Rhodanobacter sp. B2A1Ga4]
MSALRVHVEGVGLWSPLLADFAALRSLLAGTTPGPPATRPAAATLPPNERRRAPESVLLAIEAAGQALAMSGRDAATLACVFASAHGDQAITDYMCATLAQAPTELSPTRFHNSVHNAAVGYWTIATGCHAPSIAVCAQRESFGAGLLEAAGQVLAEQRPVLLVCSDTAGSGPLDEVTGCRQPFGCALVLAPQAGAATLARLDLDLQPRAATDAPLPEPLAGWRAGNPSASSLPLLALLATGRGGHCQLAAAATLALHIDMESVA